MFRDATIHCKTCLTTEDGKIARPTQIHCISRVGSIRLLPLIENQLRRKTIPILAANHVQFIIRNRKINTEVSISVTTWPEYMRRNSGTIELWKNIPDPKNKLSFPIDGSLLTRIRGSREEWREDERKTLAEEQLRRDIRKSFKIIKKKFQ